MEFISFIFPILFCFVLVLRLIFELKNKNTPYIAVLVLSSILFYLWDKPENLLILFSIVLINYLGGYLISSNPQINPAWRKRILIFFITLNLGGLFYFKYTGFIIQNISSLNLFPNETTIPTINIALPLGISFITFQAIGYLLDIYHKRISSANITEVFLYLSFFPKVASGPIIRANDFIKQINNRIPLNWHIINESAYLIISGAFLKLICADRIKPVIDSSWPMGTIPESHALDLILLVLFYATYIFCSFAGYTRMARGISYLLGFHLPINFLFPYAAGSFTQFWRNWHISLTEWIRTYLFFPLERISRNRVWLLLTPIIVMLLVGFWHGANWTFIIWGLLHGLGMSIERLFGIQRKTKTPFAFVWAFITQITILISWIFFRSDSISEAAYFIHQIISGLNNSELFWPTAEFLQTAFPTIAYWQSLENARLYDLIFPLILDILPFLTLLFIHIFSERTTNGSDKSQDFRFGKALLTGVMLFFCCVAYPETPAPFVYLQF